jgi:hypothetical protein
MIFFDLSRRSGGSMFEKNPPGLIHSSAKCLKIFVVLGSSKIIVNFVEFLLLHLNVFSPLSLLECEAECKKSVAAPF